MSETEWKMIPGYPRYEMNISTLQVRVIKSGRVLSTRGGAVTISRNAKYICLSLPKLLFFVDRNIEPSTDAVKDVIMTNENGRIVVYEKSEYMSQKIQEVYAIKRTIPAIEVYTESEQRKIISYIVDNPKPKRLGILIGLCTGMRIGEISGLRWENIDIDNKCIHVTHTIAEVSAGRKNVILMDNNVLASEYGLQQIEKIISMGVRVDFNQGLDARLVTDDIAKLLAKVKWMKRIRFGCDTPGQIAECERATALIDKYGYKGEYFFYCILLNDFKEAFTRVNHWRIKGGRFLPYCQPYRDLNNPRQIIPQWQKDLAGWADKKWIFRSCEFKDFTPRKGFVCSEYF